MAPPGRKPNKELREAFIAASKVAGEGPLPATASTILRTMNARFSAHYEAANVETPSLPGVMKIATELQHSGLIEAQVTPYGPTRNVITYTATSAGLESLTGTSLAETIAAQTADWTGTPSPSSDKNKKGQKNAKE